MNFLGLLRLFFGWIARLVFTTFFKNFFSKISQVWPFLNLRVITARAEVSVETSVCRRPWLSHMRRHTREFGLNFISTSLFLAYVRLNLPLFPQEEESEQLLCFFFPLSFFSMQRKITLLFPIEIKTYLLLSIYEQLCVVQSGKNGPIISSVWVMVCTTSISPNSIHRISF